MNKFILNGSFRSGTSFFWSKLNNAKNGNVLYEPCHENLLNLASKSPEKLDSLHGLDIWSCYSEEILNEVQKHDSLKLYNNKVDILVFANSLFQCNDVIGLQTNRWHYFYADFIESGINVFHIIRNPLNVYNSMLKSYRNQGGSIKKILKRNLPENYINKKSFNIQRWYEYTCFMEGCVSRLDNAFDMFIFTWVSMNYSAMNAQVIKGLESNIVFYDLMSHLNAKYEGVFGISEIEIDLSDFNSKDEEPLYMFGISEQAEKLGLTEKLAFIWSCYEKQKSTICI